MFEIYKHLREARELLELSDDANDMDDFGKLEAILSSFYQDGHFHSLIRSVEGLMKSETQLAIDLALMRSRNGKMFDTLQRYTYILERIEELLTSNVNFGESIDVNEYLNLIRRFGYEGIMDDGNE